MRAICSPAQEPRGDRWPAAGQPDEGVDKIFESELKQLVSQARSACYQDSSISCMNYLNICRSVGPLVRLSVRPLVRGVDEGEDSHVDIRSRRWRDHGARFILAALVGDMKIYTRRGLQGYRARGLGRWQQSLQLIRSLVYLINRMPAPGLERPCSISCKRPAWWSRYTLVSAGVQD